MTDDGKTGVLVEVNCETDFVGRNAEFLGFVNALAEHVADAGSGRRRGAHDADPRRPRHHRRAVLGETVGKLGENMGVARFVRIAVSTATGAIASYIHGGGKIGVLVEFAFTKPETGDVRRVPRCAKDVAMQVAAAMPSFVEP